MFVLYTWICSHVLWLDWIELVLIFYSGLYVCFILTYFQRSFCMVVLLSLNMRRRRPEVLTVCRKKYLYSGSWVVVDIAWWRVLSESLLARFLLHSVLCHCVRDARLSPLSRSHNRYLWNSVANCSDTNIAINNLTSFSCVLVMRGYARIPGWEGWREAFIVFKNLHSLRLRKRCMCYLKSWMIDMKNFDSISIAGNAHVNIT